MNTARLRTLIINRYTLFGIPITLQVIAAYLLAGPTAAAAGIALAIVGFAGIHRIEQLEQQRDAAIRSRDIAIRDRDRAVAGMNGITTRLRHAADSVAA